MIDLTRAGQTVTGALPSRLMRVHRGADPGDDAHVAVPYRGGWYRIADTDLVSKASLQFVMTLFSFTERGTTERQAPVITVPTY